MRESKLFLNLAVSAFVTTIFVSSPVEAIDDSILRSTSLFPHDQVTPERQMEFSILNQWRSSANVSETGERLLGWLDSANAAIQYNNGDAEALYKRAYLYGIIGCPRLAIADLTKAIEQGSTDAALHRERGVCFVDLQNYQMALDDLNYALLLNPNSGDARLARARLLMAMGRPQQALEDLLVCQRDGLEFKPSLPNELSANHYKATDYYLGACYEALGRKHEALKHYREASTEAPSVAAGAYVHRFADQPKDASVCIKRLQGF